MCSDTHVREDEQLQVEDFTDDVREQCHTFCTPFMQSSRPVQLVCIKQLQERSSFVAESQVSNYGFNR